MSDATPASRFPIVRREIDLGTGRVSMFTLVDPDALLDALTQEEFDGSGGRMPYWGTVWPSALALAEKVLRSPSLEGRRVLDLGCGLGLVGLAALERGAHVTFLDWEPEAVRLARGSDQSIPALAADLGVASEALRHCLRQAEADAGHGQPGDLTSDEREELRRLLREVKTLQQEREISRKYPRYLSGGGR